MPPAPRVTVAPRLKTYVTPPPTSAAVATFQNVDSRTLVSALVIPGAADQPAGTAGGVIVLPTTRIAIVATITSSTARPPGADSVSWLTGLVPVFAVETPRSAIAACAGAGSASADAHANT